MVLRLAGEISKRLERGERVAIDGFEILAVWSTRKLTGNSL
jgi:hypothetical protein